MPEVTRRGGWSQATTLSAPRWLRGETLAEPRTGSGGSDDGGQGAAVVSPPPREAHIPTTGLPRSWCCVCVFLSETPPPRTITIAIRSRSPWKVRQRRLRGQISFRGHTLGAGPERVRRTREDGEDRGGSGRTGEDLGGSGRTGEDEEDRGGPGRIGEDLGGPGRI